MTREQLSHYLNQNSPLVVHMGSGREFTIPHSDFMLSTSGRYMVFFNAQDIAEVIDLEEIESVTLAPSKKKQKPAA